MVIYFILAIVFALFCIFILILYQVNIVPLRQQIKEIKHSNENKYFKVPNKYHDNNNNNNNIDNNDPIGFVVWPSPQLPESKIRITKAHTNPPDETHYHASGNLKSLKILDVFLDVDEELTTMLFKIPSENFITGIHIIYKSFVLSIVVIHKDNSENLSYIKSQINNELDNLYNIYLYSNNTCCVFNNSIFLIDSCGSTQENINTTNNALFYFVPFISNSGIGHKRFLNTALITASTAFTSESEDINITIEKGNALVNDEYYRGDEIPSTDTQDKSPESPTQYTHSDHSYHHKQQQQPTQSILCENGIGEAKHDNFTHPNTGDETKLNTIVFQNNKETGFNIPQANTTYKKNFIPNSTLNMLTNIKNSIF